MANVPTLHVTIATKEPRCVVVAGDPDNIPYSSTAGPGSTGLQRYPEKVMMENLHDDHTEERSGNGAKHAGLLLPVDGDAIPTAAPRRICR
jgi:hypothetical protein